MARRILDTTVFNEGTGDTKYVEREMQASSQRPAGQGNVGRWVAAQEGCDARGGFCGRGAGALPTSPEALRPGNASNRSRASRSRPVALRGDTFREADGLDRDARGCRLPLDSSHTAAEAFDGGPFLELRTWLWPLARNAAER